MAVLLFGELRLDLVSKQLWRGDRLVELSGTPLLMLCHLAERSADTPDETAARLVTKDELRNLVWGEVHVSDETIRGCISTIRKALADDPQQPRYLKTDGRAGWRFMVKVTRALPPPLRVGRSPQPPSGPYDPSWYVPRLQEELDILGCIEYPGRPVVVYGPQGCGKTTMVRRALECIGTAQEGAPPQRILPISLRSFAEEHLTSIDAMLRELGRWMLDPSEEDEERVEGKLAAAWAKGIDPKLKLKKLVRTQLLLPGQVVYLVLSNVERLAPWRFQASFFDLLRAWQEAEGLGGLRLILETSIPPRLFPLGGQSPMWTKARRIPVNALTAHQIAQMANLYELHPAAGACAKLGELVGGLAALCRHALYRAAVRQLTLEKILQEYEQEPTTFGVFADHLEDLHQWLEQQPAAGSTGKSAVYKQLQEARRGVSLQDDEAWPLVRKGLVTETEVRGVYRLRCRLYEDFVAGRVR
jgi:DNA-binding winged helix-turn-helix (wHTH) protein